VASDSPDEEEAMESTKTEPRTKVEPQRKPWSEPQLKKRERLPRVTNGFAGSWQP
jgi:hypothetical protein